MNIPSLASRVLSDCGIFEGASLAAVIWLVMVLMRRIAAYDKLVEKQNEAYDKLGELRAKVDALLLVSRTGVGHDDD